jgi:SnoaL-like protein
VTSRVSFGSRRSFGAAAAAVSTEAASRIERAVRESLPCITGIPDVHWGNDRHWVIGQRGCSEWLLTGTTAEGERIEVRGCDLFEFRGDKIARKDSYWKIVER